MSRASGADIAGATFGGIAATAVAAKTIYWLYCRWRSRPQKLTRTLSRIAAQRADDEAQVYALAELGKLDPATRHKILDGLTAKYTESAHVSAVLALNRFRALVDQQAERDVRDGEAVSTTASRVPLEIHGIEARNISHNHNHTHRQRPQSGFIPKASVRNNSSEAQSSSHAYARRKRPFCPESDLFPGSTMRDILRATPPAELRRLRDLIMDKANT